MSRKNTYPITEGVRETARTAALEEDFAPGVEEVIDALGEYEHGSADVEDVFEKVLAKYGVKPPQGKAERAFLLEMYAAVIKDIVLVLQLT